MQTQLSSKGQLVIPKLIREALSLAPGTRFSVEAVDGNILLRPSASTGNDLSAWQPRNPSNLQLDTDQLCQPVVLDAP